jgi:hypothetical protein
MKSLPQTDDTLLIRTDYSDEAAWQALRKEVTDPDDYEFLANVHIIDDPAYRDLTTEQLLPLVPDEGFKFLIVADKTAQTAPEMPLLVVLKDDDEEEEGGELRVIAEELWSIENNISLANMDWEEFVHAADDDGVFRGF